MSKIALLANPLWQSMCLFAFTYLVFSWVQAHKGKIAVFDSIRYIVFIMAILAAIAFSKTIFINGTSLINDEAEAASFSIEIFLDNAGRAGVEGEEKTFAFAAPIMGAALDIAHFFAALLRAMFGFFQWGVIFLLYSVSPLMLAFLAHPSTQNIGVRFLTTSFGVMMWQFGFVFADIIFIGTYNEIVNTYVIAANDLPLQNFTIIEDLTNIKLSLDMTAWLIMMLILLGCMYLAAPLLIYLIFSGASPAGAIGGAIGTAVGGGAAFSRLASNLSSARKNNGSDSTGGRAAGGGASSGPSPLSGLGSLASSASSVPMMGLPASEVSQREQQKK